ncbi:RCC1 domain-containing protein [Corynebacterium variabile]|uniref:RCC1 domain-containing protein n=1 Tax=Corynebacterium variabile TaxID=1727 RepID=UPI0034525C66
MEVAVAGGDRHSVGRTEDGSAVATGNNRRAQCAVGHWTGFVEFSAGCLHTVGLHDDGRVSTAGSPAASAGVDRWRGYAASNTPQAWRPPASPVFSESSSGPSGA